MLAKCYTNLFHATKDFSNLEKARSALSTLLSRMKVTIFSLPQFPTTIYDLARVYEIYGSFEGALEMYGHVLELFPKYIKYQLVLFRSAVVMLHMSNLGNAPVAELLQKAIEMVQFILEAPSSDLSRLVREDVCMLYARLLQKQDSTYNVSNNTPFINATMSELFYIRKAKKLTGRVATTYSMYFKQPATWETLAAEYAQKGEPTLSVNCYDECISLLRKSSQPAMTAKFLLDVSEQYAKFQEYDTAVEYAQGAWMENRFNPRAR